MRRVYKIGSESSVMVYFGSTIDLAISEEVQKGYHALKNASMEGVIELIPSYASLMVQYDLMKFDYESICSYIETILSSADHCSSEASKIITIPTYYGLEVGLDLTLLAEEKQISVEEIVSLHVKTLYSVYAIGFAPGFAYLGEIDERLQTPRLANPRKSVPKGSVAIADRQSAIYPLQSPGGWKILGRTPLRLFDPTDEALSLFRVGDRVQFEAISKEEFLRLGGEL